MFNLNINGNSLSDNMIYMLELSIINQLTQNLNVSLQCDFMKVDVELIWVYTSQYTMQLINNSFFYFI